MTNPILGYDIDGQPLRAGDRVVYVGLVVRPSDNGRIGVISCQHREQYRGAVTGVFPGLWVKDDVGEFLMFQENLRKLPPKQDHEPGSWEEIAKLGWKPNLAPSTADC